MIQIDKKRILIFGIGALIASIVVNFPHLMNFLSSEGAPTITGAPFHMARGPLPRLNRFEFIAFQFLWYYLFSFILLYICGYQRYTGDGRLMRQEVFVIISKVVIVVALFYVTENILIRKLMNHFDFPIRHKFDAILFSRYLFVLVISSLTGLLMKMMEKQNRIVVENEKLRLENLQIRYNALTNQMNPHFFFNSLNSLQYLLIEGEQQKSVIYISELSTVFRYILQSSKKELVLLSEEISFLESYQYLLNIRFEDKIRFTINIPDEYLGREIPVLTLQPLVENAINHNGCSMTIPLSLQIFVDRNFLVIQNNRIPKLRKLHGEGIGLENLKKRFMLLLNKEIVVEQDEFMFKVILPIK